MTWVCFKGKKTLKSQHLLHQMMCTHVRFYFNVPIKTPVIILQLLGVKLFDMDELPFVFKFSGQ